MVTFGAAGSISTPAPVSADRPRVGGADIGARPPQPAAATAERPTAPPTAEEAARGVSPAVRRLVTEHGLDPAAIAGTGKDGRLTKEDVLRHAHPTFSEAVREAALDVDGRSIHQ